MDLSRRWRFSTEYLQPYLILKQSGQLPDYGQISGSSPGHLMELTRLATGRFICFRCLLMAAKDVESEKWFSQSISSDLQLPFGPALAAGVFPISPHIFPIDHRLSIGGDRRHDIALGLGYRSKFRLGNATKKKNQPKKKRKENRQRKSQNNPTSGHNLGTTFTNFQCEQTWFVNCGNRTHSV